MAFLKGNMLDRPAMFVFAKTCCPSSKNTDHRAHEGLNTLHLLRPTCLFPGLGMLQALHFEDGDTSAGQGFAC